MILPKEVKTKHKIRDFKIVRLWAQDHQTMEDIGKRFKITRTRVSQIIYDNRDLLKSNKEFEKNKRIIRLNRIADSCSDGLSKSKDILDVFSELRKEHDGDKPLVQINEYTQIWIASTEKANTLDSNGRINSRSQAQIQA